MYSKEIINKRVKAWENTTGRPAPPRHSVSRAISGKEALDSLWNPVEKTLLRPLTPDELSWIEGELFWSRLDFLYWANRYATIKTSDGRLITYAPNPAQKVLHSVCAEMEKEQIAVMIQILKLRQTGMTTDSQLKILHRAWFWPNTEAMVGSSDPEKSRTMTEKMDLVIDRLPFWMQPPDIRRRTTGELLFSIPSLLNSVKIQHGSQKSGLGRGSTPQVFHLSELAEALDAETNIEASLFNALHEDPFTYAVLESTAEGKESWWYRFWLRNKELWPERKSRFRPLFMPWYLRSDIQPTEAWLRARKTQFAKWSPSAPTLEHARRAEEFVRSNDLLRSILGQEWTLPREKQYFWELSREEAIRGGTLAQWLQELGAADDLECFQSGQFRVLPYEVISTLRSGISLPVGSFSLSGPEDLLPPSLSALTDSERDLSRSVIKIPTILPSSGRSVEWELRPLRFQGWQQTALLNRLWIWELPSPSDRYVVSVDCGLGIGRDRTSVTVLRRPTPFRRAGIVAEFASPWWKASDIWTLLLVLSELYRGSEDSPLLVPELAAGGQQVIDELLKWGRGRFYERMRWNRGKRSFDGYGFKTTEATRKTLIDTVIKGAMDGWFDVNSPGLVEELDSLDARSLSRVIRIEAQQGAHDDRVFSLALALVAAMESEIPGEPSSLWRDDISRACELATDPKALDTSGAVQYDVPAPHEDYWNTSLRAGSLIIDL